MLLCSICENEVVVRESQMMLHKKNRHNFCYLCDIFFETEQEVRDHDFEEHLCQYCCRMFINQKELRNHTSDNLSSG